MNLHELSTILYQIQKHLPNGMRIQIAEETLAIADVFEDRKTLCFAIHTQPVVKSIRDQESEAGSGAQSTLTGTKQERIQWLIGITFIAQLHHDVLAYFEYTTIADMLLRQWRELALTHLGANVKQ